MKTVLIVDDEGAITDLLADLVLELGYQPLTARNGQEALELLKAQPKPPALILSDVMMPRMNGLEFATAARALPGGAATPIVFMTAAPTAVRDGIADGVILKPFDLGQLLDTLQLLLPASDAGEEMR